MAHGDAREGKWRGNWRMEWVASTLTLPRNVVYPALLPLTRTPRLPVVDWTDAPADLNGLVRFGERQNLVSARVPSRFKRSLPFRLPSPKGSDMYQNENCEGGMMVVVRLDMFTGTVVINNKITSALFWDFTRRRRVVSYWHFGTIYRSHIRGPTDPTRRDR
jgi:hypothetical protein